MIWTAEIEHLKENSNQGKNLRRVTSKVDDDLQFEMEKPGRATPKDDDNGP